MKNYCIKVILIRYSVAGLALVFYGGFYCFVLLKVITMYYISV